MLSGRETGRDILHFGLLIQALVLYIECNSSAKLNLLQDCRYCTDPLLMKRGQKCAMQILFALCATNLMRGGFFFLPKQNFVWRNKVKASRRLFRQIHFHQGYNLVGEHVFQGCDNHVYKKGTKAPRVKDDIDHTGCPTWH